MSAPAPDPLAVALIRTLNAGWIRQHAPEATDLELVQAFGQAATPLAEALRETVTAEVARQLEGRSS